MNTPPATPAVLHIDFVSDLVCPWCAIAFRTLEQVGQRLAGQIELVWRTQPFELNPGLGAPGEELVAHLGAKYGGTPAQFEQMHQTIAARGREVGLEFDLQRRTHIYNTFDAHRLLFWLGREGQAGQQHALEGALFAAYFSQGENPGAHAVLLRLAGELGLDVARAAQVLEGDEFAAEVRERERHWQAQGIHSVPAVIVEGRHLIQGGQPAAVFERALRQIAQQG
ncbi:DsbA family oxidoreductase [Melaminivora jejuensis]|uniref:DsbA family oxidoreductase n=1 Tax=Melaminivora jejuensis TaxID=1267217 RepID=UPI001AE055FA|nr:DsbA family oxidoreductase [Melaminivora jejuensis]UHJ64428.1 DsbA family oxidoreductase [Melaminivora jejuensis]